MKINVITTSAQERRAMYRLFKMLSFIRSLFAWYKRQQAIKYNTIRQQKQPHQYVEAPDLRIVFNPLVRRKYWYVNRCPICGVVHSHKTSKRTYLRLTPVHMHWQQPTIARTQYIEHYTYYIYDSKICDKECEAWHKNASIDDIVDDLKNDPCSMTACDECPQRMYCQM